MQRKETYNKNVERGRLQKRQTKGTYNKGEEEEG
jgi:hypothetical protein